MFQKRQTEKICCQKLFAVFHQNLKSLSESLGKVSIGPSGKQEDGMGRLKTNLARHVWYGCWEMVEYREYWTIYRGPSFFAVVQFGSLPHPPNPLLTHRNTKNERKLLDGVKGGGRGTPARKPALGPLFINQYSLVEYKRSSLAAGVGQCSLPDQPILHALCSFHPSVQIMAPFSSLDWQAVDEGRYSSLWPLCFWRLSSSQLYWIIVLYNYKTICFFFPKSSEAGFKNIQFR